MNKVATLLIALFLFLPLSAKSEGPYYVLESSGYGLFAEFAHIIGFLDYFEKKPSPSSGFEIDFAKQGLYFDPAYGDNFWQYYFEPICRGDKSKGRTVRFTIPERHALAMQGLFLLSRERCHALIAKYICVKAHIRKKVDDFYAKHFQGSFVIGVHYRGTDKTGEAPRVSYESCYQEIVKTLQQLSATNYKIFVATDEAPFLSFLETKFPKKIIAIDAIRSSTPTAVHHMAQNKYKIGEDALIDCLLLSQCSYLIRTDSNLSYTALLFNPQLRYKNLNEMYKETKAAYLKWAEGILKP